MLQNLRKILIVCGPSGSGKSTLLARLLKEFPLKFGFSVSHTSRRPRPGETDGVHYHFRSEEKILEEICRGLFLEHARYSSNIYGTSLAEVARVWEDGKICVLDIDTQGVKQVKENASLETFLIFVKPPSLEELETRLRNRATESEESLRRRLELARQEIQYGEMPGNFHKVIVNDNLETSYEIFRAAVMAEYNIEAS